MLDNHGNLFNNRRQSVFFEPGAVRLLKKRFFPGRSDAAGCKAHEIPRKAAQMPVRRPGRLARARPGNDAGPA